MPRRPPQRPRATPAQRRVCRRPERKVGHATSRHRALLPARAQSGARLWQFAARPATGHVLSNTDVADLGDAAIAALRPRPRNKAAGLTATTSNGITLRVEPHSYELFVRSEFLTRNETNDGNSLPSPRESGGRELAPLFEPELAPGPNRGAGSGVEQGASASTFAPGFPLWRD